MRIVDLTLPLSDGTEAGFGLPAAELRLWQPYPDRGWWATEIRVPSHIGTHVDAPRHWLPDGATLERLDLGALIGPAAVLDLRGRAHPATITEWDVEAAAGEGRPAERILLATGWDRRFGTPEYFSAYPSLTLGAARWLVDRGIRLVGVETPSLSRIDNAVVHRRLLAAGTVVVEGLCGLTALAGGTWLLCVLPPRLLGTDGAPARAVAIDLTEETG